MEAYVTGDSHTCLFEPRTINESSQHVTLDAFSPFGSETAAIHGLGDFWTESWLMKMISPLSLIADECKQPLKSDL